MLIEPINTVDMPGLHLCGTAQALAILDEVGTTTPSLRSTTHHLQRMEGELAASLQKQLARIGHGQLADNPGRNEPGTGTGTGTGKVNYGFVLAHLDRIGHAGWVGRQHKPAPHPRHRPARTP